MNKLDLKDDMTPKERIKAMIDGQSYDRVPCNLFIGDHASHLIGAKVSELHLSVEKIVDAQVAAYKRYRSEGTGVGPGLGGIAEALGSKLFFPDHGAPYVSEYVIKDFSDLDKLSVPHPLKSGRFAIILESAAILVEKLGKDIPVSVGVPGPFTTAGNLRGAENFMRDLRKNPQFAHQVLRLALDTTIAFVKEAAKIDVNISIADPSASGSLISEGLFKEFAFPYLKELIDAIRLSGKAAPSLHICGNTKKIWGLMADAGAAMLSIDDKMDLAEAKKAVGDRVVLVGNVKPTETMYLGKPEDVENDAKECLRKAYDNPKGYILALGCGLPIDTPPENIHALRESAIKYGKYPFERELFK